MPLYLLVGVLMTLNLATSQAKPWETSIKFMLSLFTSKLDVKKNGFCLDTLPLVLPKAVVLVPKNFIGSFLMYAH